MAQKTWTWMHGTDRIYVEQARITPDMVGGPQTGYLIKKRRLYGGLSDGVDVVHVDNGALSFDVLPTRGMGLWKVWAGDLSIGWNSPVRGPVHPNLVPLADPSGLGWLDGFDELLVRCGLESNGAPEFSEHGQLRYGLHGRIANKPAASTGGPCGWRDWGTYRCRNRRRNTISLFQTAHVYDHHDQGWGIFAVDSRYD